MFANRFTACLDACVLAGVLRRNILLTLAEAEFFRVRWSRRILDEAERAIATMIADRGGADPAVAAQNACDAMQLAFADAMVDGWEEFLPAATSIRLPDPDDEHVLAAALKTQAAVIVTDNLKDFPLKPIRSLGLDVRSADAFIADTVDLDVGRAVAALRAMRSRLQRPSFEPADLLRSMEAQGLTESVDVLRPHLASL